MSNLNYVEEVINYLEYLGYPDMVQEFSPHDVAVSITLSIRTCRDMCLGPHMCALMIFGITWETQIVRYAKELSVH